MKRSFADWLVAKITDWLMRSDKPMQNPICDFDRLRYEIRPCDVLLIEGRSRISEVIKQITQSPWSHSAIYIGKLHDIENPILRERVAEHYGGPPDEQLIIESLLGEGTIVSPLTDYSADHIRICRPQGLSRQDAQEVIGYTVGRLGIDYDIRHVLDLARFLFPWSILPRRWRSSLFQHNAGTPTRQICSVSIAEAFKSVRFPILPLIKKHEKKGVELIPRNPRLYTPSDFDYSPYFEIIKYPILGMTQAVYRDLPWNEELLSNAHPKDESPNTSASPDKPQSDTTPDSDVEKQNPDNTPKQTQAIHDVLLKSSR